jgi:dolichyl-phosphate-mannose-protein mannosyltransferase
MRRSTFRSASVAAVVRDRRLPVVLLGVVCLLSLGSRLVHLEQPCTKPCGKPASYGLVFDERYYVNAARRMLGRPVPAGQPYATAPAHEDPNAEHPQLGKLLIAGGIAVFGDRPLGWRIGSLLFGTLAILAMYALVRAGGGAPRLALGAASLMAVDNLFLVHGRIATLDVYALALLLVAGTLYFRHRYAASGLVLALAACTKLVALYAVFIFGFYELFRLLLRRRGVGAQAPLSAVPRRLATTIAAAAAGYTFLLWLLDRTMPPYDPGNGRTLHDPYHHTLHMLHYAIRIVGTSGVASYPWQWFLNEKTIDYYSVVRTTYSAGHAISQTKVIAFQGAMNPFVIFLAIPALSLSIHAAYRTAENVDLIAVAWVAGLLLPFTLQSFSQHRTMYLYYMLLVLPGIYISISRMFSAARMPLAVRIGYSIALLAGFVDLYPIRALSGF